MKCANCTKDAIYQYSLAESSIIYYCQRHLPKFLEPLRRAGSLFIRSDYGSAVKPKKKAKAAEPEITPEPEVIPEPEVTVEPEILPEE